MSKRITKDDLLLAGWHTIFDDKHGIMWAHPNFGWKMKFSEAAAQLKTLGCDADGFMNDRGRL